MPLSTPRKALYATLVVLAVLGVLEVLGRRYIAEVPFSDAGDMVPHPRRGWTLPANASYTAVGTNVVTNAMGLRSPPPVDASGVYRILVVGDSNVFGVLVDTYQTFAARLNTLLGATYAVDVQNGGVPGYACPQVLDRYREVRETWAPDLLVAYVMHNDARLVLPGDKPWRTGWAARYQGSGVVRLLAMAQQNARARRRDTRTSVRDYQACMRTIVEEQRASGGETLLVVPTTQVDFAGAALSAQGHLEGYRQALRRVAEETGAPILDLTVQDWTGGQDARAVLLDEVHPSGLGHDLIARRLARDIAARDLPLRSAGAP